MDKHKILAAAKQELLKHSLSTFVLNRPSIAGGGSGVVVVGCPPCQKRLQTTNQFVQHLADDVLPVILGQAFSIAAEV